MLSRINAIFMVLYISSIPSFAFSQKDEKCQHCRKMAATGLSPYEVLWTLRGGIGKEVASDLLRTKMFLQSDDIKQAEGIFLEYCRSQCLHTLAGKIWDEEGKSTYKGGQTLHFHSLQEEVKYTKLAKKEFAELKKGGTKTSEANFDQTEYVEHHQDLVTPQKMSKFDFLGNNSSSRNFQQPSENSSALNGTMAPSAGEIPDQRITTNGSSFDVKTTETSKQNNTTTTTTEKSFETTNKVTTEAITATTMATNSGSKESTESYEDSHKEHTNESEEETGVLPGKSQGEADFENIINYLIRLISDPDSDMILERAIPLATSIIKCILDIIMTEVEQTLAIAPGSLTRERCGANNEYEQNSWESNILNFLKKIFEQSKNSQSAVPQFEGVISPPSIPKPQPEIPSEFEFESDYSDLSTPPEYYDDYGGDDLRRESNPPSMIHPFLRNNHFVQEPFSYPAYPTSGPPVAILNQTEEVTPIPFQSHLGSVNAFENFIVWRRMMSNIQNQDES